MFNSFKILITDFIDKIIAFVKDPFSQDDNLYSRKQLYLIILPACAVFYFALVRIFNFIFYKIFQADLTLTNSGFDGSYLGVFQNISWLIFAIKWSIKESFAYFFLISQKPKQFFFGVILMVATTVIDLSRNYQQDSYVNFFKYLFGYLIMVALIISLVNYLEDKLKAQFEKVTPHFSQVVIISCCFYWLYYSIHFNPHQSSLILVLLKQIPLLIMAFIYSWIRVKYSFKDALIFSTLVNITTYAEFLMVIASLFNIFRYKKNEIQEYWSKLFN